ncbi:hypothetical protein AAMO2058_001312200 [Amorphochlora amoebiformis]|mmetsp:Transcript_12531/g.19929  ORF Transcript_12531/g.19929 Transcript_12531/m.19929 type:complete len:714 (-) Transcript_12531:74-2215(-)
MADPSSSSGGGGGAAERVLFEHKARRKKTEGNFTMTTKFVKLKDPNSERQGIKIPHSLIKAYKLIRDKNMIRIEVDIKGKVKKMDFELIDPDPTAAKRHLQMWNKELRKICARNGGKPVVDEDAQKRKKEKEQKERRDQEEKRRQELAQDPDRDLRKLKFKSEAERRASLLVKDKNLKHQYEELVLASRILTEDEFWSSRARQLEDEKVRVANQQTGISPQDIVGHAPVQHPSATFAHEDQAKDSEKNGTVGEQGNKKTVTLREMIQIFLKYPAVQKAYEDNVPLRMSETEFWTKFYRAERFYQKRGIGRIASSMGNNPIDSEADSDANALFKAYERKKSSEEEAAKMNAKRPNKVLDPRTDLRMSEGYENYFEEELRPLLVERKGNRPEDYINQRKQEKRREILSEVNRQGQLLLSAPELKRRALIARITAQTGPQGLEAGGIMGVDGVTERKKKAMELQQELRLDELETVQPPQLVPLALSAKNAGPMPGSSTYDANDMNIDVGSLDRLSQMYAHSLDRLCATLHSRKFGCPPDEELSDPHEAYRAMDQIASKARADALAGGEGKARLAARKAGGAEAAGLVVYGVGQGRQDEPISEDFLKELREFTNRTTGFLRFYWSGFPPGSMSALKKLRGIHTYLNNHYNKLIKYRNELNKTGKLHLALMLKPIIAALNAVFDAQSKVEARVAKRTQQLRRPQGFGEERPHKKHKGF